MENKKSLFFISIEEAKNICDKVQYGEATLAEKLKLNFRLIWCKVTQTYTQKNMKLTTLCESANLKAMDKNKKDDLKRMLEGMSKQKD